MAINFYQEDIPAPKFKRKTMKQVLQDKIAVQNKTTGNINVIFCSDEYLLEMNREHLKHDYLTDVITFNFCEGEMISGDIYISYDRLKDNAEIFGVQLENEIARVVGHGVCHLLGFNDKTEAEKAKMREEEEKILKMYQQ